MKKDIRIAPSILSADLAHLADQVAMVEEAGADSIHVDVMDGHYVPNLTFGADLIATLKRVTKLPLDVHLMVERPEFYISPFADAGASVFTFHPEATAHVQRQLEQIRGCGMQAGLALNPGTPLTYAEESIKDIDLLLIMTVNPGFPAQQYVSSSTTKIARAADLLRRHKSGAYLEVDGGITLATIRDAHGAGADTFVAGSAIFKSDDPATALRELREQVLERA